MRSDDEEFACGRRWCVAVAVALLVFVFTRVRGSIPLWVELHRSAASAGVPAAVRNLDSSLLLVFASFAAARLAAGRARTLAALGIGASIGTGAVFGVVAAVPMLAQGIAVATGFSTELRTWIGVVVAPFVEELFFRGVLVGLPVRCGGLRFWPVALVAALLFGAMHVPWDDSLQPGHLGVFAATFAGGTWYAWIVRSWGWNLWTTIVLHAAMNAAWTVTGAADDAAGGVWANAGRAGTIAVGTVWTMRRARSVSA